MKEIFVSICFHSKTATALLSYQNVKRYCYLFKGNYIFVLLSPVENHYLFTDFY